MGAGAATLATAALAAGCGSSDKKSSDADAGESSAKTTCRVAATTKPTGLPAAFPVPGELTITQVRKDGPTIVVDGYWTSELDEAYTELKDQVEQAGYAILFSENEHRDAEISYKDAGGKTSGQIALRSDCSEDATTRVHITNRPA